MIHTPMSQNKNQIHDTYTNFTTDRHLSYVIGHMTQTSVTLNSHLSHDTDTCHHPLVFKSHMVLGQSHPLTNVSIMEKKNREGWIKTGISKSSTSGFYEEYDTNSTVPYGIDRYSTLQ